jgi:hypothetical protein
VRDHSTRPALPRLDDRYTRLPDALLSVLSPREHQVIHLLLSYRWTDDALIYPSVPTMAARLGCSERTIQRTIRRLESGGYVVVEARHRADLGQQSNVYRPGLALLPLLPPSSDRVVTGASADRVTGPRQPWPPKRDSGKQTPSTRRSERVIRPPDDARKYLEGRYGMYVRT